MIGCNSPGTKPGLKTGIVYLPLPTEVTAPATNPTTPAKVHLGKLLFYDPILSGSKDVACATCHHPSTGYAEFKDISIGVNGNGLGDKRRFKQPNDIPLVKRNAHTILNTAFNGMQEDGTYDASKAAMFWDNRVHSLEAQALEPLKTLEEMRGRSLDTEIVFDSIVSRLQRIPEYAQLFAEAFKDSQITPLHIAKAIASFERTLITSNSRFDQYLRGDSTAISLAEKEGFRTFKKVGCAECHKGPMFSDYKVHVLGMRENEKLMEPDSGAQKQFKFRTPTLRNLRLTAPYMHNGTFVSLRRALEFYEEIAGGKVSNPNLKKEDLDTLILALTIKTKDISPIESFLNTLNDENFDRSIPNRVPSGLPVGGTIE